MNFIYKQLLFWFLLIGCLSVYGQQPQENVIWQERDGKYFLADANGNALSSAVYDQFGDWLGDRAWVRNDQKFGIIGKQGQEMLPVVYENFILDFTESGLLAKQNGKWGFIDWKGGVVIPFQYDFVTDAYPNGLIGVNVGGESTDKSIRGGKWGFINKKGVVVCVPKYNYIGSDCQDDVIWVNIGGAIDAEGNVSGGKYGFVNVVGKEVMLLKYDDVAAARRAYRESLEKVRWKKNGAKFALYDKKTGKMMSKAYDKYWEWTGDRAIVSNNQKFGYIDKNGKEVVPVVYDDLKLEHTEEGLLAKKDGKWGFVDWQGEIILPFQYDILSNILDNGLVAVNIGGEVVNDQGTVDGGLWGYIDVHGRVIAPVKYDYVGSQWTDGMVWVNLGGKMNIGDNSVGGGKFGLIDTTGLEVAPIVFDGDQQARDALQKGLGNLFGIGDIIPDQVWDY